jgi:hypothetical protein
VRDPGKTGPKRAQRWPGREFLGEAAFLLYVHAADGGETGAMASALERVLSCTPRMRPDLRRLSFADAAFFNGVHRRNAVLALAWLEDARKVAGGAPLEDWDASALAAIALAEENWEEAGTQFRRAIARLDRQPGAHGSIVASRRRLAALAESTALPR